MNMNELESTLKNINKTRPFTMYIHGASDENFVNDLIKKNIDLKIMFSRNNIYSTFVNCGTVNTDFISRIKNYTYMGNYNVVMAIPDENKIKDYCGCILGQQNTTTGYTNHVEVDYQVIGFNTYFNNKDIKNEDISTALIKLDEVNNKLILGYYNKETDEFILNPNCVLLDNEKDYLDETKKVSTITDYIYFKKMQIELYKQAHHLSENISEDERDLIMKIATDKKEFTNFVNKCKINYMFSDESIYYENIENSDLRSMANFPSNIHQTLREYIALYKENKNEQEID